MGSFLAQIQAWKGVADENPLRSELLLFQLGSFRIHTVLGTPVQAQLISLQALVTPYRNAEATQRHAE